MAVMGKQKTVADWPVRVGKRLFVVANDYVRFTPKKLLFAIVSLLKVGLNKNTLSVS
jgi:hypothetical protein